MQVVAEYNIYPGPIPATGGTDSLARREAQLSSRLRENSVLSSTYLPSRYIRVTLSFAMTPLPTSADQATLHALLEFSAEVHAIRSTPTP